MRKFRSFTLGLDQLIDEGTLSPAMATFLQSAVVGRLNLLISGGTGSGKTTTMNVLGTLIPARERVVTIEDSAELQLGHPHVVALEYRPPNVEGKGELTIRSLLRNSLRMRPDRVMVGEVRDAAALDMLQAMNTGHDGSMSTIHANSARDAFSRLETMVMTGSVDIPLPAVRAQIASALNMVIQQARLPDGSRKIIQIAQVVGYDGDVPLLKDIFRYRRTSPGAAVFEPTGEVPAVIAKMNFYGVDVPKEIFSSDPYPVAPPRGRGEQPEPAAAGAAEPAAVSAEETAAPAEVDAVIPTQAPAAPPDVAEAAQLGNIQMIPTPQAEPAETAPAETAPSETAPESTEQIGGPTPLSSVSVGALHRRRQEREGH